MSETLYVRPDKNWALFGNVSTGGATDPDHQLSWLVDGRPGFPLRITGGTAAIQITKAAAGVNVVAICHHLLDPLLSVALSGDITDALIIPAYPPNGVPYNAWKRVSAGSPPSVNDLTLTITGNSGDILIGEVIAGEALVLDPSLQIESARFGVRRYLGASSGNELSGIPPYSEGARSRPLSGSQHYDTATLQAILDWFDSQDAYPYPVPSLLMVDSDDPNDARLVTLQEPRYSQVGPEGSDVQWLVELEFTEYPRTRW